MLSRRIVADHVGGMLFLEIRHSAESYVVPEFLTIGTMRSFNLAVLRGLPRIDEKVNDLIPVAKCVKRMHSLGHSVQPLVCPRVAVGEDEPIISFDRLDGMRESSHHVFQKEA